jgi:hypothetical protein
MGPSQSRDGWNDPTEGKLPNVIIKSAREPVEKAKGVRSMRERKIADKHNRVIIGLTLVVAIGIIAERQRLHFHRQFARVGRRRKAASDLKVMLSLHI